MTDRSAVGARRARARTLRADGWSYDQIAAELGVARSTVRDDVNGRYRDRHPLGPADPAGSGLLAAAITLLIIAANVVVAIRGRGGAASRPRGEDPGTH